MIYIALSGDTRYLSKFTFLPWGLVGVFYIGGAFINVKSIPEKFFPRTLDIIGSSHQIFHMCVVIACAISFEAGFQLFLDRHDHVCPIEVPIQLTK